MKCVLQWRQGFVQRTAEPKNVEKSMQCNAYEKQLAKKEPKFEKGTQKFVKVCGKRHSSLVKGPLR